MDIKNFISTVIQATKDSVLKWEKTSNPNEYLSTTVPQNSIGIYKEEDSSTNTPPIVLYMLDNKGDDVFRLTIRTGEEYFLLNKLYEDIQLKDEDINKILHVYLDNLSLNANKNQ